jgi:hypothetical protein
MPPLVKIMPGQQLSAADQVALETAEAEGLLMCVGFQSRA